MAASLEDQSTKEYLASAERMHKVVLTARDELQLHQLLQRLSSSGVKHAGWREQPEDMLVALASAPQRKSLLQPHFKHLQLFK